MVYGVFHVERKVHEQELYCICAALIWVLANSIVTGDHLLLFFVYT